MYVEPEGYQNTDNILYNKPHQLVLVAFSTKRKMHTCRLTIPAGANRNMSRKESSFPV